MFSAFRASPPARRAISSTSSSGDLGAELVGPAAHDQRELLVGERHELVDLAPRQQRRVDLEVRVLRRRADQRQRPLLDRRQQRVLLGLVEAVDLVEEEDRPLAVGAETLPAEAITSRTCADRGGHGRQLLEGRAGRVRDHARERRLPAPGRPVQDRGADAVLRDREPQRGMLAEDLLLADEILEPLRPHAHGQRSRRLGAARWLRPRRGRPRHGSMLRA